MHALLLINLLINKASLIFDVHGFVGTPYLTCYNCKTCVTMPSIILKHRTVIFPIVLLVGILK